jgi:hypothetical protein
MWREKSTGNLVKEGSSWVDKAGVTHPRNWHIWSKADKEAAGLEELTPDPIPNDATWWYTQDAAGKVTKTEKSLTDVTENGRVTLGVKSVLINNVKSQQGSLLAQTDWAIIRKADKGTAIPSNIQTWRDAIRSKATAMETAITNAADTDAIEALFLVWDGEGNKSGILYDWPELVE